MATTPQPISEGGCPFGPVHHVFVDFENLQEIDLSPFRGKAVELIVMMGERQKAPKASVIEEWFEHAGEVRLVKVDASGRNALDMALAFQLGSAVAHDPWGYFHIVSRDKDFDPLVAHLGDRGLPVFRDDMYSVRPPPPPSRHAAAPRGRKAAPDAIAAVVELLWRTPSRRPKRQATLRALIHAQFPGQFAEAEVDAMVQELARRGIVQIDAQGRLSYRS
jgi:hypothetical protein